MKPRAISKSKFINDDGVTYGAISIHSANVNILEIPRSEDIEIIPYANIKSGRWSLATVAALISNFENTHTGKKVIAAINGDFFDIDAEAVKAAVDAEEAVVAEVVAATEENE